jgi:hypothetical protein
MQQVNKPAYLSPSSMSAGGEQVDTHNLDMSAPGSQPVSGPLPSQVGPPRMPLGCDDPAKASGPQIPVSNAPGKPAAPAAGSGFRDAWTSAGESGGGWKETP